MKIRPQVKPASRGADEGWAVLSTLISGFVVFGGVGWLLDRWWGTHLMVPVGVIVGMALSIYAVVMQFGRPDAAGSDAMGNAQQAPAAVRSTEAAAALRTEKALNRARAVDRARAQAPTAVPRSAMPHPAVLQPAVAPRALPPNDGPPPASTRRETECL